MFAERAERLEKDRVIETPRWLAVDEVHLGSKKHCVVTDPVGRRVLDLIRDDSQKALMTWLLQLPDQQRVEVVTMDMSLYYLGAVRRRLGHAKIVVDRYHVHNLLNTAIKEVLQVIRDRMSASEQRKYMRDPRLLLASRHQLSGEGGRTSAGRKKLSQEETVAWWLEDVPDLGRAYWLKEGLSRHFAAGGQAEGRGEARRVAGGGL
jgi:transposase